MKVSLRWLSEFVKLPTDDVFEIRTALENLGHEVEGVERFEPEWTKVTTARVLSIEAHPDADRVRVCTVSTGDEPITVVCGAWNFGEDAIVAFAEPGAVLPGDFAIGTRTIRGVESKGMICSERELNLGDDHEGILVLGEGTPIGVPLEEIMELPDTVFDLSITPNRPDAMSIIGITRDIAGYFGLPFWLPSVDFDTVGGTPSVGVRIDDPTGCLRFTIREITGATLGPSPFWMRQRLRRSGVRPISNAVDVTNYVMLELGHPLHAFDAERIAGDTLVIRRAVENESIVTLDGVRRDLLAKEDLVIVDEDGPTSLAGTMGGEVSEVHDGTSTILLEAATWDPPTIMNMSRRHGLRSEASARFERGVDPELPAVASARAARLMAEVTGGSVLVGLIDEVAVEHERPVIDLSVSDVERILGDGFSAETITSYLQSIELVVSGDDPLKVTIPGFRPDLTRPIDLVEEVARLHGYGKFADTVPTGTNGGWTSAQRGRRAVIEVLVGAGLSESIHLSFISTDDLDAFAFPSDHEARSIVRVRNPLREEEALLRTTLLPQLLERVRANQSHGLERVGLFEIGSVFFDRPSPIDPRIPDQPRRVAWVIAGGVCDPGVDDPEPTIDARTSTGLLRAIARRIGAHDVRIVQSEAPGFHPGRCATVEVGGRGIGTIGEIHPLTAAAYDLSGRVTAAEIDVDRLIEARSHADFHSPSTYPRVEFDLAFLLDEATAAVELINVTSEAAGELLEMASVFDEYLGLGDGQRSLAIRYVLRANDRTLTNEEVGPVRQRMIDAGEAIGAVLRGSG